MVTLVVLDGFGCNKSRFGNAIKACGTPNLKKLLKKYPHTKLLASGNAVGLPAGQMGNSEVGHLTLGAGRVILQNLEKINQKIDDGSFFSMPVLKEAMEHAKKNNSSLHLLGLLSDGGVHSHISHLQALLSMAKEYALSKVYIHIITDGRDTKPTYGQFFVEDLLEFVEGSNAKIATICGRIYAMDREKRYDRLKKAYNLLVSGKGEVKTNPVEAVTDSYRDGKTDEFIEPVLIDKNGLIKENDSVIFYNFRSDRAKELSFAFTDPEFKEFKTKKFKNLYFASMEEYDVKLKNVHVIFPVEKVEDNLSAIISQAGLKQFHIAETTKYAHVTFFFNGTIEKPYKNEDRKLIESIETTDFSPYPKMKALEITTDAIEAIASKNYDFILINYSNTDMLGHTGNFNSAKEAAECVDKQAYAIALATLMAGGECIITADHGNAEVMYDRFGAPVTSHTTNKVPFILVSNKKRKLKKIKNASIANVAPTVLKLLNLEIPQTMFPPLVK